MYADEEAGLILSGWGHQSPQPLGTRFIAYAIISSHIHGRQPVTQALAGKSKELDLGELLQ